MTAEPEPAFPALIHGRIQWGSMPPFGRLAELARAVEQRHPGNRYYRFSVDATESDVAYLNESWDCVADFRHHGAQPETSEIADIVRRHASEVHLQLHELATSRTLPFAVNTEPGPVSDEASSAHQVD